MKKILQILAQKPGETGSGIFLKSLMREMAKKEYTQGVLAGISSKDLNIITEMQETNFYPVIFDTKELPFSVPGMSDVMPYDSTRYIDMDGEMYLKWKNSFKKVLDGAVEEFEPDIFIVHHLWLLASLIKQWYPDIPMIGICHGTDLRQMNKTKKFTDEVLKGCKNIEKVFALNKFQKEKIQRIYGIKKENIVTTGSAYNGDVFYPNPQLKDRESIKLVYVGKLSYAKGVMPLLEAYDDIDIGKKHINLTIVGSGRGREAEDIKEKAQKIGKKVIFTGMVNQEELGEILRDSEIFILPSFYEGLPLVLIEALACGLRVVTTDLPGVRDWIGNKVNSTGVISYVALPRLKNSDEPVKEDIPIFTEELKYSIENHIRLLDRDKNDQTKEKIVLRRIRQLCWESLFSKMEGYIDDL
jgi:glycosyltransferase involved in cell wall biosynthesis